MTSFFWGMPMHPVTGSGSADPLSEANKNQAERAARKVQYHEDRLNRLTLICMALWDLIREQTELTEEDLLERVRKIDLMDGREDGKAKRQIAKCPQCARTMSPRHKRCMYCGAEGLELSAFDTVL